MKIRCRIGYHNWGRWSEPWITTTTFQDSKFYDIHRTLECQDCGVRKNETIRKNLVNPGPAQNVEPVWNKATVSDYNWRVIDGGKK